jgi:hypothetical protein
MTHEVRTLSDIEPKPLRRDWRGWKLVKSTYVLKYKSKDFEYEVDLEHCRNSAEVLDWIAQVSRKVPVTAEMAIGLVYALDDILHFQGRFCGLGQDHQVPAETIRKVVRAFQP